MRLRHRGFGSFEEAEGWLIKKLDHLRRTALHGERATRTFEQAAVHREEGEAASPGTGDGVPACRDDQQQRLAACA
jgi:hypothetical protein